MSTETYSKHLEYLPKREREAAEEALYIEECSKNLPMMIVRQLNRSIDTSKKPLRNVHKQN